MTFTEWWNSLGETQHRHVDAVARVSWNAALEAAAMRFEELSKTAQSTAHYTYKSAATEARLLKDEPPSRSAAEEQSGGKNG